MTNTICMNENSSTTRLSTKTSPIIKNTPEDKFETLLLLPEGGHRKAEGGLRTKGYFKKSYNDKPLISIITVIFNGEKYLEQTIQSVINQNYDNVEYIIIDGGSTDGTVDIIKKYGEQIDYWVSEKDKGIYDAMNKGISLATGDLIGLINADDWYSENIFNQVSQFYHDDTLIYGDLLTHFDSGAKHLHNKSIPHKKEAVRLAGVHPTVFIAKNLYKKVGLFDLTYKLASDYDLMIRMFLNNANIIKIDEVLAHFRAGGVSADGSGAYEGLAIAKKHHFSKRVILKKRMNIYIIKAKNIVKKIFLL